MLKPSGRSSVRFVPSGLAAPKSRLSPVAGTLTPLFQSVALFQLRPPPDTLQVSIAARADGPKNTPRPRAASARDQRIVATQYTERANWQAAGRIMVSV